MCVCVCHLTSLKFVCLSGRSWFMGGGGESISKWTLDLVSFGKSTKSGDLVKCLRSSERELLDGPYKSYDSRKNRPHIATNVVSSRPLRPHAATS